MSPFRAALLAFGYGQLPAWEPVERTDIPAPLPPAITRIYTGTDGAICVEAR